MSLSSGTSIIYFADDALVVCPAENVEIPKLRINENLFREKHWLNSRSLEMALEKTEALQNTDKRSFT